MNPTNPHPTLETLHYLNGKMIPKIKPMFPSYLFARLDIHAAYCKVKACDKIYLRKNSKRKLRTPDDSIAE
jgi:hypothetical protein